MLWDAGPLHGLGPGLYFDLARLSFQVPTLLSAAIVTALRPRTTTATSASRTPDRLFMIPAFVERGGIRRPVVRRNPRC